MITHDMVPQKVLILEGDSAVKSRLEELLSEGPCDIFFAKTGCDGLESTTSRDLDIATVALQLQNMQGKTGLYISSTEGFKARLFVVTPAAPLDLTEEPLEIDIVGKLDRARQKEEHSETPENSVSSQGHWRTWLASFHSLYNKPCLQLESRDRPRGSSRFHDISVRVEFDQSKSANLRNK